MSQINFADATLKKLIIHFVGNAGLEEKLKISEKPIQNIDDSLLEVLKKYFLTPFKGIEYFHFTHHSEDLNLNEMYHYCEKIFESKDEFVHQSALIASHLYENSNHPKIQGGELYVAFFNDILVNDESTSAIGIFKSENKDTFLKINIGDDNYDLTTDTGININKLDKGCLILELEKENGYLVCSVDHTNKGNEALYWKDNFLKLKPKKDAYFHTNNYLKITSDFIQHKLKDEFELQKIDEVDLMNRSLNFFKKNENFDFNKFTEEILPQEEVRETFKSFKKQYEKENDFNIADEFEIHDKAVKKQARVFKSILKLDKNFHIYVHGNRDLILRGQDEENGMNYYKLYFKEEN